MSIRQASSGSPRRIGFLLMPGFALTSFSLAVEAPSVVNQLGG